ncbi:MAG: hypothetical protein WBN40_05045 [Pseudomonadales bacterium]
MSDAINTTEDSRGIQELITLLKDKGVKAGKDEGVKIISDAEKRADWIVEQAQEEARKLLAEANQESEFIRNAGKESLLVAFRDIKLRLKDELSNQFAAQLKGLIHHEMQSPDTLKQLLFCAASNTNVPDEKMEITLPAKVMGLEELRENPASLKEGPLVEVLSEVTRKLLKSEVTFKAGLSDKQGITFSLQDGEIVIELTDEALTKLLLMHLQPRFRALLEGVVA